MIVQQLAHPLPSKAARPASSGLRNYYALRAGVALLWVAAAFLLGTKVPLAAAALLIAYPAWDAAANLFDAARNGGLARNRTQALNLVVSAATAVAVAAVIGDMRAVLGIFGAWAIAAGLLQLATGVRRWSRGAQWAMVLSGAQSALAGGFFVIQSRGTAMPGIGDIAPYAAFGAFYFLVSAAWLTFRPERDAPRS